MKYGNYTIREITIVRACGRVRVSWCLLLNQYESVRRRVRTSPLLSENADLSISDRWKVSVE